MDDFKITDTEVEENGVEGAAHYFYGDPDENQKLFDKLPKLIVAKFNAFVEYMKNNFYTKSEVETAIKEKADAFSGGTMIKEDYDADDNGKVDCADNADKVNGFWFSFTDAEGNTTDEPYIHWEE